MKSAAYILCMTRCNIYKFMPLLLLHTGKQFSFGLYWVAVRQICIMVHVAWLAEASLRKKILGKALFFL